MSWVSAQRSAYIALLRKGWVVTPSRIATGYFTATKHEREESVSSKDFLDLFNLANAKDAAWTKKQREKTA